jgi:hypothetical protein
MNSAKSYIRKGNRSLLNFLIYEGNLIFFFYQCSARSFAPATTKLSAVSEYEYAEWKKLATAWKMFIADLALLYIVTHGRKKGLTDFVDVQNLTRIRWVMSVFFDASAWLAHIQQLALHKIRNKKIKRTGSQQAGYLLNTQKLSCTKSGK